MSHRTGKAVALCALVSGYLTSSYAQNEHFSPAQRAVLQGTFQVRAKEAVPRNPRLDEPRPDARPGERPVPGDVSGPFPTPAAPPHNVPQPMEWPTAGEKRIRGGPVGTAFQLTHKDVITAAHVLRNFIDSRYDEPVLVGADNRSTYEIESVQRYDETRDIAVIRLRPPPRSTPLEQGSTLPDEGATVHFAGLVRIETHSADEYDGAVLFDVTDAPNLTPEGKRGFLGREPRTGLLRFAEIPRRGMSGGPLLDDEWKTIGMIVSKDPREAFASAVPIRDLQRFNEDGGPQPNAIVGSRSEYSTVAALECDQSPATNNQIRLPLSFGKLSSAVRKFRKKHVDETVGRELKEKIDSLAHQPVSDADRCDAPGTAGISPTGEPREMTWASYPEQAVPTGTALPSRSASSTDLASPPDAVIIRTYLPPPLTSRRATRRAQRLLQQPHLSLARLGQSQSWMAQLLQNRHLGGDIGRPEVDDTFTDGWKRTWLLRQWRLPEDEIVIISLAREVSGGYVVVMRTVPTAAAYGCTQRLKLVTMRKDLSCPRNE